MKYMPFLQMTRRTVEILNSFQNDDITPYIGLIDVTDLATEKRSNSYNESQITIPHFVDYTNSVTVKDNGIPAVDIRGDRRAENEKIRDVQSNFPEMAIRFHTQDFSAISEKLDMVFDTGTLHVIIELGYIGDGINTTTLDRILNYADENILNVQIYILASSIPENLNTVCTSSSTSVIDNSALLAFNSIISSDDRINFGDYCGYEASTPSEYVAGMRIVPKTIMLSTNSEHILIVRTCNIDYKWGPGMTELLSMLKTDRVYDNFAHDPEGSCEGCEYLFDDHLDKATPETIKVACMKHNIATMTGYIQYYNSTEPEDIAYEDFF